MKKILSYLGSYKKEIIIAPFFKFIETITEIIIPLLVANMIDIGVGNKDFKYIAIYGSIVIGLNIIGLICAIVCQKYAARASIGLGSNIRKDLYKHINSFSHEQLDKFGTATLNNRLTHDVSRIQTAIGMFIRMVMRTPFLIIGSAIMAMIIDIKLSIVFLVATPLIVGAVFMVLHITEPLYAKTQKNLDKLSEITRENLQGIRVIRAFNKQSYEEKRFNVAATNLCKSATKVTNVSAILSPITGTIINFSIIAILWFGGFQVNIGVLTSGQIIAFVNYLTQIAAGLISLANIIVAFIKAINCAGRITEVFNTKASVIETNNHIIETQNNRSVPKIEFKDVSFSYGAKAKNAINHLTIQIMPGETIGIIGGTGSGKSSIANLIPRFYDVSQGELLIDGINVKDYSFKQLRSKIGLVPQKAVLFKGTLKDNMLWRKPDASLEEITKAIKISQSEEFVNELTDKFDYKIHAGGKNFSGGQRQRLTIARALVGDPEIFILDDSASALDFATDANLRKSIKENIRSSTVILISQRANTVKNANKIIVLENGDVVGIGKHKELLENCVTYKEIYESQTK